ncbi:outer membrane beta-barrel protein [Hymenobacter chitinivorans]|uniref:Carboxypeptidase family protein n=1 Tax=Hymenobacter chitinivorans DSM 11115 TaxID=1121954 RepID=A0A2M9B4V0_9BACT|nr:outer membrane beta-barrel protein [Hymenobacter chitinivorans]PJJ52946.1 carboxypeptidase family protein [Hymenobacter chitinivorans DSM 11115]
MRLFLLLLLAALLAGPPARAQKAPAGKGTITGTVLDSVSGKVLREASVSLLAARDSSYLTFTITNGDGQFGLRNVAPGSYQVLITFLGYKSRLVPVRLTEADPTVALGGLALRAQSHTLGEVVVEQERAPVAVQGDTLAFSARAFKTQPNAAVEALLKKLPGVEVDRAGNIRAQGQAVSRVLVDGKPFFGDDPKMATRNLPADIIDQVQLYSQRSDQAAFSGIDDGNQQRTLNLVTKRDKRRGYFGTNGAGAGTDGRYQARLGLNRFNNGRQLSALGMANNLNQQGFSDNGGPASASFGPPANGPGGGTARVRTGGSRATDSDNEQPDNILESGAVGLNYRDAWGKRAEVATSYLGSRTRVLTDQQSRRQNATTQPDEPTETAAPLLTDQQVSARETTPGHRFNLRLDYTFDSLTTVRVTPFAAWQRPKEQRQSAQQTFRAGQLLNQGQVSYQASTPTWSGANNLLLMRRFPTAGRTFSLNLNTTLNDQREQTTNQATNTLYAAAGTARSSSLDQQIRDNTSGLTNALNLSWTEPLSLTRKLEGHYNLSATQDRADRAVRDYAEATGHYDALNPALSNKFTSQFWAQRAGLLLQTRRLRYTYSLGLDAQESGLRGQNQTADSLFSRRFHHVLPNALLSYNGSQSRTLRLNYRTRLNAPPAAQLQPVADNSNPLNMQVGNPALRPEYVHALVGSFSQFNARTNRSLFVRLDAAQVQDRIVTSTTFSASGVQTTRPVNADGYRALNGFLAWGQRLAAHKVNLNLTTNAGLTRSRSFVNEAPNLARTWSLGQGLSLNSTYNDRLEFGLSGNLTYQQARYSLLPRQNTAYFTQTLTADVFYQLPGHFIVTSDIWFVNNSGRAAGYNQRVGLWNVGLTKQFLANQQAELKLQVYDLLNQNRSVVRNVTDTYLEDVRSRVLTRYLLLSFTYNLRKFGV